MSHLRYQPAYEYRGYHTSEIDALVNSGQAYYMGHGLGREGAYNWIDNWYDRLGNKMNGKFYDKPECRPTCCSQTKGARLKPDHNN